MYRGGHLLSALQGHTGTSCLQYWILPRAGLSQPSRQLGWLAFEALRGEHPARGNGPEARELLDSIQQLDQRHVLVVEAKVAVKPKGAAVRGTSC